MLNALPMYRLSAVKYKVNIGVAVEIILWIMFLCEIVSSLSFSPEGNTFIFLLSYYTIHVLGIILILLSLRYLPRLPEYEHSYWGFWMLRPVFVIILSSSLIGLLLGIVPRDYVYLCLLPIGSSCLILLTKQVDVRERLINVFCLQTLVAILLGIFGIYKAMDQSIISPEWRDIWFQSPELTAVNLLFAFPFLLGCYGHVRGWQYATAVLGYAMYVILNIRALNRASIVIYIFILPILCIYIIANNWHAVKYKFYRIVPYVLPLFLLVLILFIYAGGTSYVLNETDINDAWRLFAYRFTSTTEWTGISVFLENMYQTFLSEIQDIRGAEAIDFINFIEPWVYLTGRGFGTTWYSHYWNMDWNVVHYGPLYLIFRGGVPLLLTYTLLFYASWKRSYSMISNSWIARGCFLYLSCKFIAFIFYGAYISTYSTYTLWLIVGLGLSFEPQPNITV